MLDFPIWALVIVGGPILLAAVIAYALLTQRKLTLREKQRQDEATRRLYSKNQDQP